VSRRLIVSSLVVAAVCGGLAVPALAGPASTEEPFKLCLLGPTPAAPKQQGICVGWIAADAVGR